MDDVVADGAGAGVIGTAETNRSGMSDTMGETDGFALGLRRFADLNARKAGAATEMGICKGTSDISIGEVKGRGSIQD